MAQRQIGRLTAKTNGAPGALFEPGGDQQAVLVAMAASAPASGFPVLMAAPIGGEFLVNTNTAGNQQTPSITALANGGFVVVWDDFSGTLGDNSSSSIKAQLFDADGDKMGGEFLVNTATLRFQSGGEAAALTNGGFVVTWTDDSRTGGDNSSTAIKAQMFDSGGGKVAGEFLVNTTIADFQNDSAIASLAGGGFVVTWNDFAIGVGDDVKGQVYDAAGNRVGGEFLVNTQTAINQRSSSVTGLAAGGFVVVWEDQSGTLGDGDSTSVKAQVFNAAGVKVGTEFLVNTETAGSQNVPTVTALANGGFVVTWEDADDAYDGVLDGIDYVGIKAQIFDASGVKVGTEFLVSTMTTSNQYEPSISALGDGGFVVTWGDSSATHPLGDGSGGSVRSQVFDAAGARVGSEFRVNDQVAGNQSAPAVTGLANGDLAITWVDASGTLGDGTGTSIKAHIFSADGDIDPSDPEPEDPGTEFRVNGQASGDQTAPAAASLTNGGFVVTWTDESNVGDGSGRSVKAQLYDAAGAPAGAEFTVNSQTATDQDTPTVTGLANGGFVVTWEDSSGTLGDASSTSIKAQIFDAAGAKVGSEFLVNTLTADFQADPTIASLANGGFVVTWWDNSSLTGDGSGLAIRAQIFDAAGAKVGTEFGVNTRTDGAQNTPVVTGLPDGNFVVVWDDAGFRMTGQIFSATGAKVGSEFVVDNGPFGGQFDAAITTLANGGFVVTWWDFEANGLEPRVYSTQAQVFGANGARVGGVITVPTTNTQEQESPAITALSNGGFVVTWADRSGTLGDDSIGSIKAQIFDAAGGRIGGEFLVNTITQGLQDLPAIAALPDGGFVVTWEDNSRTLGDTSGTSIKAQIFDATGAKVGAEPGGPPAAGTPEDDTRVGTGGDDIFRLEQGGDDTASGGDGDDGFYFGAAFTAGDSVTGGVGGEDQVGLQGDYSTPLALTDETLSGVETIALLSSANTEYGGGSATPYSYYLVSNDASVAANALLTVNANGLQADESVTFDGSAETDGRFRLIGGAGTDTFNDGAGDDILFGGLGADVLGGGGGDNRFVYTAADQSTAIASDQIFAFDAGDLIDLTGLGFRSIGGNAFSGAAGELRYVEVSSRRWQVEVNLDGDLDAEFVLQVFTSQPNYALSDADFAGLIP